jgi:hypothetical protein
MDVLDETRFTELSEPHRRELQVHSYRMRGNLEQARTRYRRRCCGRRFCPVYPTAFDLARPVA